MKLKFYSISLLCLLCAFSACSDDEETRVPTVQYIELSETEKTVFIGESWQITAKVTPEDAINTKVVWSNLHPEVGTIDAEGNVSAVAVGTDSIYATVDNVRALCIMKVKPVAVDSVAVSEKTKDLSVGDVYQLKATVYPENATNKTVVWSSDNEEVAKVDAEGKVSALAKGQAVVTAKCGTQTATCSVTVFAAAIELSMNKVTLAAEGSQELELSLPISLAGQPVEWKSLNDKIVTVEPNADNQYKATVKAVGLGRAQVQAAVGDKVLTCEVFVGAAPVMQPSKLTVDKDASHEIELMVPFELDGKPVVWKSLDEKIVKVAADADHSNKATVTGLNFGRADVQATVEGVDYICTVYVGNDPMLSASALTLDSGTSSQLTLILPARLEGKAIEWKSLNEKVAKVVVSDTDQLTATVEAVDAGTTDITATIEGETVKCTVTVNKQTVVGDLELSATSMNVEINLHKELKVTVPAGLEGQPISWKSLDPATASVKPAADGLTAVVSGLKAGSTEIEVSVAGKVAKCAVTVTKSAVYVEGTTAILRLNLCKDEASVAAKIKELDGQGVTEYRLIGDFGKLGKMVVKDGQVNVFAHTNVEVIDFSGIEAATLPKVEVTKGGAKAPGLLPYAFDSGRDATVQLFPALKTIILPEGMEVIGQYAFQGCRTLEEIVAPSVTTLGGYVFGYCPHLTAVKLLAPSTITAGDKAFPKSVVDAVLYLHENNRGMATGKNVFGRDWKDVLFVK